ncbi:MAG: HSP90 family protein [Propioniciclava sp.]
MSTLDQVNEDQPESAFKVDLTGMVDLLSRHLYSGPQVFVRELLQNAVDAVRAREGTDGAPNPRIDLTVTQDPVSLSITDNGIGLTLAQAGDVLATIGRSSKRGEDLGAHRREYIGQFGIGLLAAFVVADEIRVTSRAAVPGAIPIHWVGRADGTFTLTEAPGSDHPVGTTVALIPRADADHWFDAEAVADLAVDYGSFLPYDVGIEVPVDGVGLRRRRLTLPALPWEGGRYATDLTTWCQQTLGFTPLAHIDLSVPEMGLSGVAFVLPEAVHPSAGRHRVYVKRMLVGHRVDDVLPDWAFFVRAVINSGALTPTASREQIHSDEVLLATREALGDRLKQWALSTLSDASPTTRRIISTHHLALRSLALTDGAMLEVVARVLPFETTDGPLTLAEVAERGDIVYTATTDEFRSVATVARAQGVVVVNAGYVYDASLMERLQLSGRWSVRQFVPEDVEQVLAAPAPNRVADCAAALSRAQEVLQAEDCAVSLRRFDPASVPAMLIRDPDGERRRELDRERRAKPDLWGGLLDAVAEPTTKPTRTLVLNDDAAVVNRLLDVDRPTVFDAGVRAIYLSAVMLAGEGLRGAEVAGLTDALDTLLGAAVSAPSDRES